MLAIPSSAVALTAGSADAQSALQVNLDHQQLNYGQPLVVTGNASSAARGQKLWLQFAPANEGWRSVSSTNVKPNGRFRLVGWFRRSGAVRVVGGASAAAATSVSPASTALTGAATPPTAVSGSVIAPSTPRAVTVQARFASAMGPIDTLNGQSFNVTGRLLPGKPGRLVKLQGGNGHGWQTLTTARTRANGHFKLHYGAGNTGGEQVRLAFPGDTQNRNVATRSVPMNVYRTSVASWYDDGGATACGFHAGMGVAHKSLPCGTKVTFHYNGRSVTAVVDDRGPFTGGREWDLNQNVAGALGFGGVDTVWSTV
jgi:hypothetical protein